MEGYVIKGGKLMQAYYNSLLLSIYNSFLLITSDLKRGLNINKSAKKSFLCVGPLVFIIVVLSVIFVTWAIGQTICWAQLGKSFEMSVKIKEGVFKLGCR